MTLFCSWQYTGLCCKLASCKPRHDRSPAGSDPSEFIPRSQDKSPLRKQVHNNASSTDGTAIPITEPDIQGHSSKINHDAQFRRVARALSRCAGREYVEATRWHWCWPPASEDA